jgi:hypothetical protein
MAVRTAVLMMGRTLITFFDGLNDDDNDTNAAATTYEAAVKPASNKVASVGDKAGKTAGAGFKAMGGWATKWGKQ